MFDWNGDGKKDWQDDMMYYHVVEAEDESMRNARLRIGGNTYRLERVHNSPSFLDSGCVTSVLRVVVPLLWAMLGILIIGGLLVIAAQSY